MEKQQFAEEVIPNCNGINTTEKRDKKIIISVTSYPVRMQTLYKTLKSLLVQSMLPDAVIVYLAREQFSEGELPDWVKLYEDAGVQFIFCEDDLKPHKKYFYVMQAYPEDIIITVDDDQIYPEDLVAGLIKAYEQFPHAVIANQVHRMTFDENGDIMPYKEWKRRDTEYVGIPRMDTVAVGVSGVLYPPHVLDEKVFDKLFILNNCLFTDDLWLKAMSLIKHTPIVLTDFFRDLKYIAGTQEEALWHENLDGGRNDVELANIEQWLKESGLGSLYEQIEQYQGESGYYRSSTEYLEITLQEKQLVIKAKNQELKNKDQELKNKNQELKSKNQELKNKEQKIQNINAELENKNQIIKEKDFKLNEKKGKLEKKEKELEKKERELEKKNQELEKKKLQLEEKKAIEKENQKTIKKLQSQYEKIKNSKTYKIGLLFSKPFWLLKRLFKR